MPKLSKELRKISDYFILLANKNGKKITNKKLQKLVYYTQAWSLAIRDKALFNEPIEAWIHGPSIRELYREYKRFGFNPIEKKIDEDKINLDNETKELLDEVWDVYGKFDANYLEYLTHSEEPWQKAREGLEGYLHSSNEIKHEYMKDYYRKLLKETKENGDT